MIRLEFTEFEIHSGDGVGESLDAAGIDGCVDAGIGTSTHPVDDDHYPLQPPQQIDGTCAT